MPENFKNILIIKPSSLGDIIHTLPALSALRSAFPDAKISWLIRPEFAAILENHPHIDEIIHFDRKFLGKAWFHPCAFASLISLIRRLRRGRYDAVFDFQGLFRTAFLGWLSGCKKRFGVADTREPARFLYTHTLPQDTDCIHVVDYYLKIVRSAGVSVPAVEFILPRNPVAADSVAKLLRSEGIAPANFAVFVPSSAHRYKCWPTERFAALADRISSQFDLSIVATAAESEAGVIERMKSLANVFVVNLAGRTSLTELIALMDSARLVISNDTGPGHIAAALGKPLVMLFGHSNPKRLAPYKRSDSVVAIDPDSRGLAVTSSEPKHDITHITVDEVFRKVRQQLNP